MGHFAKIVNNKVIQVIVAEKEFFETFIDTSPGSWIETSYNTRSGAYIDPETGEPAQDQSKALRKNFAGIGYTYDAVLDAFMPPKPFESWILNEATCQWEAPIPKPEDGFFEWDEAGQQWVSINYEVQQ